MTAVADNDVLLKAASYGLLHVLVVEYVASDKKIGYLGAARYMLPKVLQKARLRKDAAAAVAALTAWFDESESIEPTDGEIVTASQLERAAQKLGVQLHGGESQLCAVVMNRGIERLLTGDKQAIGALHALIGDDETLATLSGRIHCLEIIVQAVVEKHGVDFIRRAICDEPGVDKTLSIVFSCSNPQTEADQVLAGLHSYISDIKKNAGRVFADA
jgi:hypothetical protein